MSLIPVNCFLNRVFPASYYKDDMDHIVSNRTFKPRKDCDEFHLATPIDWESLNQLEDRNWRMQLQGWAMFHPIMNFFDSYHSPEKIIEYFFDVAFDWYENYGNDANDIVTSRMPKSFAWYDMSVGFRALVIAFFKNRIDAKNFILTDNQSQLLEKLIDKHITHLSFEAVFSLNNHGMFQIQGLMALIQLRSIKEYQIEHTYALNKMESLIRAQYDEMGVHQEHSPHYHFYALLTFEKVLLNDWYIEKPIIKELLEKARAVSKWMVDPLARPACIGDSILKVQRRIDFSNKKFSDVLEIKTSNGVLSNFHKSGYQIFRSAWNTPPALSTYVFLMGMYQTKSHKHRDCLTFEWFDNGDKIICDGGKYGYKSDKFRNYFLSSKAHNSVEIEGFDVIKTKPYGSCLDKSIEKDGIIEMSGFLTTNVISHKRTLVIKPNHWIIVKDDLNFQRKRKITQWFHPNKDYKLTCMSDNRLVLIDNKKKSLIINCCNDEMNTEVYNGDEANMKGFISEDDFQYESSLAIGFSDTIKEKKLVTILATSEAAEKEALLYLYGQNTLINKIAKKLLGKLSNVNRTKTKRFDLLEGKYTYQYLLEDLDFIFYAHMKKDSDRLTIMLPGAVNRSKTRFNFQRYSWSNDIDGSVISFLDPTVDDMNDITIGWFQGDKNSYAIPVLVTLIEKILKENNLKAENLTIFGSSAGGFTSLKIADNFPHSKIVVINPQTHIFNYSYKEYQKLVGWVFPESTPKQAKIEFNERLKISLDLKKRTSPILYFQNTEDAHHVHHHLQPLIENVCEDEIDTIKELDNNMKSDKKLQVIYYTDAANGHSPLGKEETLKILNV